MESELLLPEWWLDIAVPTKPFLTEKLSAIPDPGDQLAFLDELFEKHQREFRFAYKTWNDQHKGPLLHADAISNPIRMAETIRNQDINDAVKQILNVFLTRVRYECAGQPPAGVVVALTNALRRLERRFEAEDTDSCSRMEYMFMELGVRVRKLYGTIYDERERVIGYLGAPAEDQVLASQSGGIIPAGFEPLSHHAKYIALARAAFVMGRYQDVLSDIKDFQSKIDEPSDINPSPIPKDGYNTWINVRKLYKTISGSESDARYDDIGGFRKLVYDLIASRVRPKKPKGSSGRGR